MQTDIKRVIAYSTMSQIGYMFVGAGLGAYPSAMFHLMTHAFFKALLFLAAGIAIHALAGEQDIRKLAGIGKLLPFTKIVFLVGSLALVGIPPFAGFFSKDPIIAAALGHGGWYGDLIYAACVIGRVPDRASTRSGSSSSSSPASRRAFAREHFHAPPRAGGAALDALDGRPSSRVLSTIGGFLQFAPVWTPLSTWLDPVAARDRRADEHAGVRDDRPSRVAVGLAGISVAWAIYAAQARRGADAAVRLLEQKFYWDELYDLVWYREPDAVRPRARTRSSSGR